MSPTSADVDSTASGRGLTLATGTAAILMAAIMFVALTPPRSTTPVAVDATTLPSATIRLQNTPRTTEPGALVAQGAVRIDRNTLSRDNALTLPGAPNAVSAETKGDTDDRAVASSLPDDDQRIIVLTVSHTYDLVWSQIERIDAPDGSIVMTRNGELIASFIDGELRLLVS